MILFTVFLTTLTLLVKTLLASVGFFMAIGVFLLFLILLMASVVNGILQSQ